jgi:hypothetical protein
MKQAIVTHSSPECVAGAGALLDSVARHLPGRDTFALLCNPTRETAHDLQKRGAEVIPVDTPPTPAGVSLARLDVLMLLPVYDQILFMEGDVLVVSDAMSAIFDHGGVGLYATPDLEQPERGLRARMEALGLPEPEMAAIAANACAISGSMLLFNSGRLPARLWYELDQARVAFFGGAATFENLLNYYFGVRHGDLLGIVGREYNWTAEQGPPPRDCCALHATGELKPWHPGYAAADRAGAAGEFARATAACWREYGLAAE